MADELKSLLITLFDSLFIDVVAALLNGDLTFR